MIESINGFAITSQQVVKAPACIVISKSLDMQPHSPGAHYILQSFFEYEVWFCLLSVHYNVSVKK
jgi:hypothetical protein